MIATKRSCTVLVLNWNGAEQLERCLPSVVDAADFGGVDVWVVDNGSTDRSADFCRTAHPSVRFFHSGGNLSLAAYNLAAASATTDVLVLLNNDVVVEQAVLAPLLAHFDDPEVFGVSPSIRDFPPGSTTEQEEATGCRWTRGMLRRGVMRSGRAEPVFYNCGGAFAVDRRKFLELGGFDRLYFPLYFEDIDLSWRAWKHGWRCLYEPGAVVYHAGGATMGRNDRFETMLARNEFFFHWKNLTSRRYLTAHLLALPLRLAVAAMRRDVPRLRGFAQALLRLPDVLQARRNVTPMAVRDDEAVVALINSGASSA